MKDLPANWTQAIGLLTTDPRFASVESPLLLAFAEEVLQLPNEAMPLMTEVQLDALCTLIMCDDPSNLTRDQRDTLVTFANVRSREHGFTDWVAAFHALPRKAFPKELLG